MFDSNARIAEVPLLFESKLENHFNKIWVIACNPETQIQRLMSRLSCDRDYALLWISHQMPLKDKIKQGNRVIYTDVSLDETYRIIKKSLEEDLKERI